EKARVLGMLLAEGALLDRNRLREGLLGGVVVSELCLRDREVVQRGGEQRPVVVQAAQDRDLPGLHLHGALPVVLLGGETAEHPEALGDLAALRSEDPLADPETLQAELLRFGVGALVDERPRELVERSGRLGALPPVPLLPDRERFPQQLLRFVRLPLDL